MKRDECLVRHFFDGYGSYLGDRFSIRELPDQTERELPAVEVVAENKAGIRFAAEHTLVQPFDGEKADSVPFMKAFSHLEGDSSTKSWIPTGVDVILSVPVGAVPKGEDWEKVGADVLKWLQDNIAALPEGTDDYPITGLSFPISIRIEKAELPGFPGTVFVMRQLPGMSYEYVIRKAFVKKLPKLIATQVDKRILILEKDSPPHGNSSILKNIKSLQGEFPELFKIDQIWVANTVAWEREEVIYFYQVWPDLGPKFKISPASLP
jgi:hypothetical protein